MKAVPFAQFDRAYLMSDLHLDDSRPALTRLFVEFLQSHAHSGYAFFLIGDIFEAWVGDDDDASLPATIARELRAVAERGVSVFFMHGNRDFLLGQAYARKAGMRIIPDPCVVTLGGIDTLLSHGDRYCISDHRYQAFRHQSRDPAWQAALLAQPLEVRRALAKQLRRESQEKQEVQRVEGIPWVDVDADAVVAEMASLGMARLIHGHTHRPAVHALALPGGRRGERIVLSDWREAEGEAMSIDRDGTFERHCLR